MENNSQIIIYQTEKGETKLEVPPAGADLQSVPVQLTSKTTFA